MAECYMSEVLLPDVWVELAADHDKEGIIRAMAQSLVDAGRLPAKHLEAVVAGALERETIGSTGIGHGIAIPHCRTDCVDDLVCVFGRCQEGVDFESLDGESVYNVFFLLTPLANKDEHLSLMKNFASQIRKEHFCDFLRQNTSINGLIDLLKEFENS